MEIVLQPEQQKWLSNQILMNNISAYCLRYRDDVDRILSIVMRDITNPPKTENHSICRPLDASLPRLCFVINLLGPQVHDDLRKNWKSDAYFFIESNLDAIAYVFQTQNLVPALQDRHTHFFLGYQGEDVIAPLQVVLRQTTYAGKLNLGQVIAPSSNEGIAEIYVEEGKNFPVILRKTIDHVFFNFGHITDSVAGLKAVLENGPRIATSGGVTELENVHKDKPIAVIGAGPSLDKDIDLLTANQDKFIIIAVDAAVTPLVKKGCRVDYVTTIERYNGFQEKFFETLPPMDADLVCFPVVHHDVIKLWPGVVRLVYRNYAWFSYFERNWPMGILESGGSAAHLAAKLALHLGAAKVYLIGCDMTYEKHASNESWRSHCLNTVYSEDWDKYYTEAEIQAKPEYWGFYDVEANDGSLVKTHVIYHQWAKEFASMMIKAESKGRIVTTAGAGVKTPRLSYEPLQSVVEKLSPINVERKCPANMRFMKPLDHTEIIHNFKAIHSTVLESLRIIEELLKDPSQKSGEAVRLIRNTLYDKLAYDTFFTAFYIQNSAMEFFKAEARFYAAPTPKDNSAEAWEDEHYEQRLWGLSWVFKVLEDIGTKTLAVFDETTVKEEVKNESIL